MKAFDFFGNELNIGDKVICMVLDYRSLAEAEVLKITDKKVKLRILDSELNTGIPEHRIGGEIYQFHNQVIKKK